MYCLGRSHSIRLLLVAAAIHMLGACPCGCLENNGWYQAAVTLLGYGGVDVPADDLPCEGESHCHDTMLATKPVNAAEPHSDLSLWAACGYPAPLSMGPENDSSRLLACAASPPNSAPLSMLQVLRL